MSQDIKILLSEVDYEVGGGWAQRWGFGGVISCFLKQYTDALCKVLSI